MAVHLHGHKFQIVGKQMDMSNPNETSIINENQANPLRRDTVQIPGGGSVTLRFLADSPGSWFFHCHIEVCSRSNVIMRHETRPYKSDHDSLIKPVFSIVVPRSGIWSRD